jgi:hypothetical protein
MKKIILSAIVLATMSITIIGCNKEEVVVESKTEENTISQNEVKSDIDNALFTLNESSKRVNMKDVKSSDETHFFYQFEGENFAFDNDESFLNWASKKESRSIFIEKYNFYKAQQKMATETGMIDDEEATQRYTDELIANAEGKDNRVTLSLLYDNTSFSNVLLPVITVYPTMGGQKNRAESMHQIANAGALCDKSWFRGDKFWYFAIVGGIPSFGSMNNRAESIY